MLNKNKKAANSMTIYKAENRTIQRWTKNSCIMICMWD